MKYPRTQPILSLLDLAGSDVLAGHIVVRSSIRFVSLLFLFLLLLLSLLNYLI